MRARNRSQLNKRASSPTPPNKKERGRSRSLAWARPPVPLHAGALGAARPRPLTACSPCCLLLFPFVCRRRALAREEEGGREGGRRGRFFLAVLLSFLGCAGGWFVGRIGQGVGEGARWLLSESTWVCLCVFVCDRACLAPRAPLNGGERTAGGGGTSARGTRAPRESNKGERVAVFSR